MKVWLPLYSLGGWVTIEREWLSQPEWSRAREEGGGWRAWSVGPLRLVSTSVACSSSVTGSYSPRQGMVHHSDIVRVVVVHLPSCKMCIMASVLVPTILGEALWRQRMNRAAFPDVVASSPTTRGRVKGPLAWLVPRKSTPSRETHACGRHGHTPARRVRQGWAVLCHVLKLPYHRVVP